MEVIPEMEMAARHAVAQGWCEPEISGREMDAVLADAISRPVGRALTAWWETAAMAFRNADYYRGLMIEIGKMLGDEAYISDDGSRQDEVLCAKVPELVKRLLNK